MHIYGPHGLNQTQPFSTEVLEQIGTQLLARRGSLQEEHLQIDKRNIHYQARSLPVGVYDQLGRKPVRQLNEAADIVKKFVWKVGRRDLPTLFTLQLLRLRFWVKYAKKVQFFVRNVLRAREKFISSMLKHWKYLEDSNRLGELPERLPERREPVWYTLKSRVVPPYAKRIIIQELYRDRQREFIVSHRKWKKDLNAQLAQFPERMRRTGEALVKIRKEKGEPKLTLRLDTFFLIDERDRQEYVHVLNTAKRNAERKKMQLHGNVELLDECRSWRLQVKKMLREEAQDASSNLDAETRRKVLLQTTTVHPVKRGRDRNGIDLDAYAIQAYRREVSRSIFIPKGPPEFSNRSPKSDATVGYHEDSNSSILEESLSPRSPQRPALTLATVEAAMESLPPLTPFSPHSAPHIMGRGSQAANTSRTAVKLPDCEDEMQSNLRYRLSPKSPRRSKSFPRAALTAR